MSTFGEGESLTKKQKIIPSLLNTPEKLSETNVYTSTPIELLAEFLFSIMTKDYEKALNYCTQILNYEPCHSTVQKFYPLIMEKLGMKELEYSSSESSETYSSDSSRSSENSFSQNEILKAKSLREPSESYRSFEGKAIEEIRDRLDSNLMTSEMKTKNRQIKIKDGKKIIRNPSKKETEK